MDALTRLYEKKPSLSVFLTSLTLLMALQYKPAVLNYTTRFVDFAVYMLEHGMTLFPIADDLKPYPDYTVSSTVLVYLTSLLFGRVSILSLGFPYCVAASLMLVLVYRLGALHDRQWGVYGVLFSLLTWSFLDGVNSLALDVFPALVTVLCFYLVYSADVRQVRPRLGLVFIALALGFAFRGPIGLIGPGVVVGGYYLVSGQWRRVLGFSLVAGLILLSGVGLLSWAACRVGGKAFMQEVWEMQGLGRISSEHAPRYYFYFSAGLITYGFTVFFALNVIGKKWKSFFRQPRTAHTTLLLQLTVWLLALLILFTVPNSKKARYVLSITPALALLAGYVFVDRSALFERTRRGVLTLCLALPAVGMGMLVVTALYGVFATVPLQPNYMATSVGLLALAAGRHLAARRLFEHAHRECAMVVFGVTAFLVLDMFFFNPITYHLELAVEPTPKVLPYWFW